LDLGENIEAELGLGEGEEVFRPGLGYYPGDGEHGVRDDSDSVQEIPQEDDVSRVSIEFSFLELSIGGRNDGVFSLLRTGVDACYKSA
jgi:hypothetical protein